MILTLLKIKNNLPKDAVSFDNPSDLISFLKRRNLSSVIEVSEKLIQEADSSEKGIGFKTVCLNKAKGFHLTVSWG